MKKNLPVILSLSLAVLASPLAAQNYNFNQGDPELIARDADDDLAAPPPAQMMQPNQMMGMAPTDVQVRLQALEVQLRNMNGLVERLQYSNQQMQNMLQRSSADSELRFQQLEKRLTESEAARAQAASVPAAIPAESPAPELTEEEPAKKPTLDTPSLTPSDKTLGTMPKEGKAGSGDPQRIYDTAFMALRQSRYDEAEKGFKGFLAQFPKHKLVENSKYWLAEIYYTKGNYAEAAVAFADTYQQFPKGNKAPDNLLKMAMALGKIDKKKDACLTLSELDKLFPNASSVIRNRAEQEKKSLGCA